MLSGLIQIAPAQTGPRGVDRYNADLYSSIAEGPLPDTEKGAGSGRKADKVHQLSRHEYPESFYISGLCSPHSSPQSSPFRAKNRGNLGVFALQATTHNDMKQGTEKPINKGLFGHKKTFTGIQ